MLFPTPRPFRLASIAAAAAAAAVSLVLSCWTAGAAEIAGLGARPTIVAGGHELERTAAQDLKSALAARGIEAEGPVRAGESDAGAAGPAIIVGTAQTHPLVAREHAARPFAVDPARPEGYHMALRDGALYIVGSSPKGAMNGVFRYLARPSLDTAGLDEHAAPRFRLRAAGHKVNQSPPPGWSDEDQARFYASHFINLVWGEKHGPPMPYAARRKYGLGLMVEVRFPPRDAAWMDDPSNASAVYRHNPGEPRRVISPFDPVGRKAYLDAYTELLAANPDTKVLYALFGDYSVIPNEKSVRAGDGAPYGHSRVEGMREVLAILKEAIGDRDVVPMAWMWHGFMGDPAGEGAFMGELAAAGDGILYNEAGNNDNWLIHADNFAKLALETGPDGKTIFGPNYMSLVSAGGACESVNPVIAMPLPRVAAHKLRRLADAGVQTFALWWGSGEGWAYQPNLEAAAEMIWDPAAYDPVKGWDQPLFRTIAERDFGPAAAPRVLAFWKAFDDALVTTTKLYLPYGSPERPAPDADGLQIFDWYQRMGIFTETVFSQEFAKPLTPSVLAGIKHTKGGKTWRTSAFADANYRAVLAKLDAADAILADLLAQDLPGEVRRRVADSWAWAELYRHLLASQHNYLRAITALHETQDVGPESEQTRALLEPVVRDEIGNLAAMMEHVRRFPPNFNIAQPHLGVARNQGDRDAEIAKLQAKRDAMEMWLGRLTNLAEGRPANASSEYSGERLARFATDGDNATLWASKYADGEWIHVDLGKPVAVRFVSLAWRNAWGKRYEIQVATDLDAGPGAWKTAVAVDRGAGGGVAVHRLPDGTTARYVRMKGVERGTDWGYALEEIQVFGPGR
jgi:hypothetical protein